MQIIIKYTNNKILITSTSIFIKDFGNFSLIFIIIQQLFFLI